MDHPMLDRMQAFLLRNERKSVECSPYLNEINTSQNQNYCYPQLSERNESSEFNVQLNTPQNPRKSISSNYSYDGLGKVETPNSYLPSYVYQYGNGHSFLHKMQSLQSTQQLNVGSSIDFSPANKENSMSLYEKTMGTTTTPVKRKISTPFSQASNTKRTDYSPAQNKSVSSFRVPGSEKKTSYVDKQTKFYDKIKNAARKDASKAFKSRVSTPSPQRNAIPRLDIAHLSKNGSKTSFSSREHSLEKKNIGNVTFDNIKVKNVPDYKHTRKDAIEGLLKKNPKKAVVTQTKPAAKLKTFKPKQEEFTYEENHNAKSRSPTPNRVKERNSSAKKELREVKHTETKKPKIVQSKSVQRLNIESKKKLNASESLAEIHESYKEEIKNLIKTIKSEKEQITSELEKMSKELRKYKKAYKKMKKEFRDKKESQTNTTTNSKPSQSRGSTERNNEDIVPQNDENDLNDSLNNDLEDEGPGNLEGTHEMPLLIETLERINNIDELKNEQDQRESSRSHELNESNDAKPNVDLVSQMNILNKDVENILNGIRQDYNSTKGFEFKNQDILSCIIGKLSIDPKLFQRENIKQDVDISRVNVQDLIITQQQMIQFLVKKLQNEEKQRLKTEEQAQEMITSMEITIKNLEENKFVSRDRRRDNTPSSTVETNKSFSSVIN